LTLLLLPVLRKTAKDDNTHPRIVIVASEVHHWSNFPEKESPNITEVMNDPTNTKSFAERYPITKLMNVSFAQTLANHLQNSSHPEDKKITVCSINPGLVSSELGTKSDDSVWGRLRFTVMISVLRGLLARNVMEGAKTSVYAAIEPQCGIENGAENGLYYSSCRVSPINSVLEGEEGKSLGERLWKETIEAIQTKVNEFDI